MNKYYLGIDPGNDGYLIMLTESGEIKERHPMPTIPKVGIDIVAINKIIAFYSLLQIHAVMEDVHAIFGASAGSTFSFGRGVGILQALLVANGIPHTLVKPKEWQKVMFQGVPEIRKPSKTDKNGKTRKGLRDTKKMSELAAKRLFPDADLRKTERSTKVHDGVTDSLLMAEYCRRNF